MRKTVTPFLGALNKITKKYVLPSMANKEDKYICIDCNKDLILKKGNKRIHHFSHYSELEQCTYYSKPSESQVHKDAKFLLKWLLENKIQLTFIRKCNNNNNEIYKFTIPVITDVSTIELEHRFNYNDSLKIADVAYLNNLELVYIFEICNTHKTNNENRPEPWFEINALKLISLVNQFQTNQITELNIECIREKNCNMCNKFQELDNKKLSELKTNQQDLEWYIRYKLGQRSFCDVDDLQYYLLHRNKY